MRRVLIVLFSVVTVAAVAWPAATSPPRDSIPLSSYPMFAGDRPTEAAFYTAVRVEADGSYERLTPRQIGGTDQVVLAGETVARAVRRGETESLCDEIATNVGPGSTIAIVTETYDAIGWFSGNKMPEQRTIHATCEVGA